MPKRSPKSAFYFYMLDFKEEQKKTGINYNNMAEVAEAAGLLWKDTPPCNRTKYEERAKREKEMRNIPKLKYTSTGVPLSEIEREEKELYDAEEAECQDVRNMVKLKCFNGGIVEEYFYVMDVNYYCKTAWGYLFAESTVLRFSIQNGVIDQYHEIIHPGRIPMGYTYDVKLGCKEIGLGMPDEEEKYPNSYHEILSNIVDYLKQTATNSKGLPPVYTMPEKVAPVHDFITQLCAKTGEDESRFRIYKLDTLFFTLINAIKTRKDEGFPRQSLALSLLKKDSFKYSPGLGCELHEVADKTTCCTTSRAKRWAFTVLDSCCPVAGADMLPGTHMPADYDLESILTYNDQKKERARPSVAGQPPACLDTSTASGTDLDQLSLNVSTDDEQKERARLSVAGQPPACLDTSTASGTDLDQSSLNVSTDSTSSYVSLRMPKIDFSRTILPAPEVTKADFPKNSAGQDFLTIRPAPEFTEADVPKNSARRGHGLAGSSKMNVAKNSHD